MDLDRGKRGRKLLPRETRRFARTSFGKTSRATFLYDSSLFPNGTRAIFTGHGAYFERIVQR